MEKQCEKMDHEIQFGDILNNCFVFYFYRAQNKLSNVGDFGEEQQYDRNKKQNNC